MALKFTLGLWALLFVFQGLSLDAAECGGSTPCGCGDTVTRDYVMTADLGPCPTHGLFLADGTTLDGNGHLITGPRDGSEAYGVYLRGTTGGVVRNVAVTGFRHGMRLRDAHHNRLLDNETFRNSNYGFDVAKGSSDNTWHGNLIYDNGDEGIHFGTGSRRNAFNENSAYDNVKENIYVLASDNNTFRDNTTWGGQNSVYVKDSSFNLFEGNTFQDATAVVRADSHDNTLADNDFIGTGVHFQVYTKVTPFRYPHSNTVTGGTISGAARCVRFSSSWANVIEDTLVTDCGSDIFSRGDKAEARNSFINVSFDPGNVDLDGNSAIDVGWHLDVHVEDQSGTPLAGAVVRAFDADSALLFDVRTDSQGDIDTQEVIEYTKTKSGETLRAPLLIETTKTGYATDHRWISFAGNTAVRVVLQGTGASNSAPVANAGPNRTVLAGEPVMLDGSGSFDPDADPLTYSWDFGNGIAALGNGAVITHRYAASGRYTATLTVSDGKMASRDATRVTVGSAGGGRENLRPRAVLKRKRLTRIKGQPDRVLFNGSRSRDRDGTVAAYEFVVTNKKTGVEVLRQSLGVPTVEAVFPPGVYRVTLTVTDNQGAVSKRVKKGFRIK